MEKIKTLIIILIIIILGIIPLVFLSSIEPDKTYEVEITFCDGRPKQRIFVESYDEPNNSDIKTYKRAVPLYKNYLNVCDVKTIREIKK